MSTGPPGVPLTKRMTQRYWMAIDFVVASFAGLFCLLAGMNAGGAGGPVASSTPLTQRVPIGPVSPITPGAHVPPAVIGLPSSLVLAAVVFLAVGLRRRGPMTAFWVLASVVVVTLGWRQSLLLDGLTQLAMAYVVYLVAATCPRRTSVLALVVCLAEIGGVDILFFGYVAHNSAPVVPLTLAICVAWMIGYSVRQRRAYVVTMQERAASSAVEQERLRIARELHDVVAHSMSVIAVQAGFGEYVIDSNPADAREALGVIQATSREALAELRRMLGMLRQQEPGAAPLAPEPRLADLDRLVERTRAAGIEVSLVRTGIPRALPASLDVSAYRIIQEALTNVVRHAGGGARCAVAVGHGADALLIEVTDNGGPGLQQQCSLQQHHSPGSGHGLIGMRERAHLCGGELSAGPLAYGGFRVSARLPVADLLQQEKIPVLASASS